MILISIQQFNRVQYCTIIISIDHRPSLLTILHLKDCNSTYPLIIGQLYRNTIGIYIFTAYPTRWIQVIRSGVSWFCPATELCFGAGVQRLFLIDNLFCPILIGELFNLWFSFIYFAVTFTKRVGWGIQRPIIFGNMIWDNG